MKLKIEFTVWEKYVIGWIVGIALFIALMFAFTEAACAHELNIDEVVEACITLTGAYDAEPRLKCVETFLQEASRTSDVSLKNRHCKNAVCSNSGCNTEAQKRRFAVCMSGH